MACTAARSRHFTTVAPPAMDTARIAPDTPTASASPRASDHDADATLSPTNINVSPDSSTTGTGADPLTGTNANTDADANSENANQGQAAAAGDGTRPTNGGNQVTFSMSNGAFSVTAALNISLPPSPARPSSPAETTPDRAATPDRGTPTPISTASAPSRLETVRSPQLSLEPPEITAAMADDIRCWICYGDYTETPTHRWVKPCKCRGSLGFTHESCLLRFISSKGDAMQPCCPQCQTPYRLISPVPASLVWLRRADSLIGKAVPYVIMLGAGLSAIFVSTTYGVYVLMAMGGDEADKWLADPEWGWRVWAGLPLIPVGLVVSRLDSLDRVLPLVPLWLLDAKGITVSWPPSPVTAMVVLPWLRAAYKSLRRTITETILLPILLERDPAEEAMHNETDLGKPADPAVDAEAERARREQALVDLRLANKRDMMRMSVDAIVFPAVAAQVGRALAAWVPGFKRVFPTTLLQSLVGGVAVVVAKDVIGLRYRYLKLSAARRKRVVNYIE
ncbi:hypothetical protein AMAG_11725 [Allomyces macrogynus ATCC 38327]|uniref:RING-CH-type domain-containing protein n=1 Tax=Allomyces macrogynus (strain ATCC 38327) TaxID=578462 RepID=A0A0L0SVR3_ALLM3|nr:hypothetical protein AMAG_11725 [Allomyces macrogynus ATCC 38327]|eukprot:KNE66607.1 hypothetical protein AMAG_11725 [Allomyces macrogynus ATCC 38327]